MGHGNGSVWLGRVRLGKEPYGTSKFREARNKVRQDRAQYG